MSRRDELLDYADTVKGFMPRDEGLALFEFALAHGERSHRGTWLEIGACYGLTKQGAQQRFRAARKQAEAAGAAAAATAAARAAAAKAAAAKAAAGGKKAEPAA